MAASDTSLVVTWTASTDAGGVAYYMVRRSTDETVWAVVFTSPNATTLTFTDTGLQPATRYYYQVQAVDTAGNASGWSASVSGTTTGTRTITWTEVGRVGANATTYRQTGLPAGATRYFRIKAFDAASPPNVSAPSAVASCTTNADAPPNNPPSQVVGLAAGTVTVVSQSKASVPLTWTAATDTDGTVGLYQVFRSNTSNLIGISTTPAFTDATAFPGSTVPYYIRAVDDDADAGPFSDALSVVVPPYESNDVPPDTPVDLIASQSDVGTVTLSWRNADDRATAYRVYLAPTCVQVLHVASATTTTTAVSGLADGTYDVAVSALNDFGESSLTDRVTFTIRGGFTAPPTAVLTVEPRSGLTPLTVTASLAGSIAGSRPIVSYYFNFGDGSDPAIGTTSTVSHTYPQVGSSTNYAITGRVTDSAGTNSEVKSVTVNQDVYAVGRTENLNLAMPVPGTPVFVDREDGTAGYLWGPYERENATTIDAAVTALQQNLGRSGIEFLQGDVPIGEAWAINISGPSVTLVHDPLNDRVNFDVRPIAPPTVLLHRVPGVLTVRTNATPPGLWVENGYVVQDVRLVVGTAPTGSDLTVAIYITDPTTGNRTLWASGRVSAGQTRGVTEAVSLTIPSQTLMTFDITAVGSTVAGSDLLIVLAAAPPPAPVGVITEVSASPVASGAEITWEFTS